MTSRVVAPPTAGLSLRRPQHEAQNIVSPLTIEVIGGFAVLTGEEKTVAVSLPRMQTLRASIRVLTASFAAQDVDVFFLYDLHIEGKSDKVLLFESHRTKGGRYAPFGCIVAHDWFLGGMWLDG